MYFIYSCANQKTHRETDLTSFCYKKCTVSLAGVAQWIESGPENQRVAGLIPSQGTRLGCPV